MKTHTIALFAASLIAATADEADKAKLMEQGKALFATCMACHGPDGKGIAAGPNKMAPSLSASPFVAGEASVFALVVLKGIAKENQNFLGMMMPMEGVVPNDEKLAALLTYVRNSFDNAASIVTPEDAKKFREQWKDVKAPVTRAKLKELEEAAKK
jgi:mono/diheme cytochrome c family protein